jgi:hypothetical protein
MEQGQNTETGNQAMFGAWMSSAMNFWEQMVKMGTGVSGASAESAKASKSSTHPAMKSYEAAGKIFQAAVSAFSDPKNMGAALKGADAIPEFLMQMSRQIYDGCFEVQKQFIDRAKRMGQQTKAYSFDDIDQEMFKSFREIYEKEFTKFFQVPQVGLTRFYQERLNRMMDKFNLFHANLSEFIYLFYVPLEKAASIVQEKISLMAEKGELQDDTKFYYNMWVKILEGHYMTLLQSPEYTQSLDSTITALVEYREAKDDLMYDFLQNLPIPTNRDMDALYKEFHVLKQKMRELCRKMEEMETAEKSKA